MNRTEIFVAMIADVVGSRDVPDRAALQVDLQATLAKWSAPGAGPERGPVIGPEITAGDGVQVLLGSGRDHGPGAATTAFLSHLTEALRPVQVLFGIGVGTISTPPGSHVGEIDGPCFHHARAALERSKREGRWAAIEGPDEPHRAATDALLRLIGEVRGAWTDRQAEVVRLARTATYRKDVAARLDVSPSVVTEVLGAARFDAILEAERAVALLVDSSSVAAAGTRS